MYYVPPEFLDALQREFGTRLRIRWSLAQHEFHIEQQVGNAALPPRRISPLADTLIRARDGYAFVMAVKAGNHTACGACGARCAVPELRTADIRCPRCKWHTFGAYYPLTDVLIQHLKKLDPIRDGHKTAAAQADLETARAEWSRKRAIRNTIESATYDDKYRLFGTPFFGYGGMPRFTGESLSK